MSKQFFVSGSNATFDLSGVKQEAPQIITDPNAPVHADRFHRTDLRQGRNWRKDHGQAHV